MCVLSSGMFGWRGTIGCFVVGKGIIVRFGLWLDFMCSFELWFWRRFVIILLVTFYLVGLIFGSWSVLGLWSFILTKERQEGKFTKEYNREGYWRGRDHVRDLQGCSYDRRKWSLGRNCCEKLLPKLYGLYRIVERVKEVAYRLEIPPEAIIHNVFRVEAKIGPNTRCPTHSPISHRRFWNSIHSWNRFGCEVE